MTARTLYIKNGDAVDQVERLDGAGAESVSSGPDAFIADLLRQTLGGDPGAELLVMSRQRRDARYRGERVRGRTYDGGRNALAKLYRRPWTALSMLTEGLRFRPERVICGTTGELLCISWLIARLRGVPLVHSRHNRLLDAGEGWFKRCMRGLDLGIIRGAEGVICHGPYLKHQLAEQGVDNVVEFEVDLSDLDGVMQDATPASGRQLLFVGRFEEQKGVTDLLDAAEPLFEEFDDLEIVFVGGGGAFEALRRRVDAAGLIGRVTLLGAVPHREIARRLQSCYAVVTPTRPSFPEGRCMVILEALIARKPVIAPDFGPFPFAIKDGDNGLLFTAGDVLALRAALSKILQDRPLYERLCAGAARSRQELLEDQVSFASALSVALRRAELEPAA
ncbi:MAG: glycosyltransferase [Pseudomonadota bacterium]